MARGADRRRIFVDYEDYQKYLELLGATVVKFEWNLLAFCLMPNHIHLLLETPLANLGRGIHWLHFQYALYFNKRHHRIGVLFEGPYRAPRPIRTEEKFLQLVGYIALNPVAAALSKRAEEWPWSSHSFVAADATPTWLAHDRLRELIASMTGWDAYEALVARHERDHY